MRRWSAAARVLQLAATLALAAPAAPPPTASAQHPRCASALCLCRGDRFACSDIPFHRFPDTEAGVRHVSLAAARLGALHEAALDGRALRTLVLVASQLHHIEPGAFASMMHTLASLDLGYNEFTEIPIEALRELKVLNWLNLQNNYISELHREMDWGFLADSLSSLSLSNNHLCVLHEGALASLRALAQLELDGNRLRVLAASAFPPALSLLRLSDNLLPYIPCASLASLPRLRHLHLRNNVLRPALNRTCRNEHVRIDTLDLSHNDLDDGFEFEFHHRLQLKQLILDLNDFTSVPSFVLESGRLQKLSISYNRLTHVSDAAIHALKHDLEQLDLDHNELSSVPATVREMVRLRQLSLAYNQLEELANLPPHLHSLSLAGNLFLSFPSALSTISPRTLGFLDLGYNQIAHISTLAFGPWSEALATLSLKGNKIAQLAADTFPATLPVRELILSFNDLYYVDASAFGNITESLKILELSSTLFSGEFPLASNFDSLSWLSLDNNNIHYVSVADMQRFSFLEYINLDFNKIIEFPSENYATNGSYRLKELRLAYNYVSKINGEFLSQLVQLQSVDLSHNRVRNVSERSFARLSNLVYLSLAANVVEYIAERAFCDLPRLQALELQENNLVEFSTEYFDNVSNEEINMSVNVSHNRICSLVGGSPAYINVLDLSNNLLETLSRSFFDSIGSHLRHLLLSHNKLTHIDSAGVGALPALEILNLHDNNISALKRRAFADMPALQNLDLSHNRLAQLAVEQFHTTRRLRHLRLDGNALRSLPRDCFKNTVLEHLDLSDNRITIFPSSALAQVGFTLRRLDLTGNRLEYLDAAMFHTIAFLHELSLAHNALTVLSDNTFAGLARLRRLDLSQNAIKTNFKELFHNLPRLRKLVLAEAGLRAVPPLPLANLTELDLTGNHIASYRETDVRRLINVRVLNIARNKLTSLQPAMWAAFPYLVSLDMSYNPIVRVSRGSFEGLHRLLRLRMDHLRHAEAVEPRAFRSLTALRALETEVPPAGRSATLADMVAWVPHIESLCVRVRDTQLDLQLRGLRAPKLRELELHGATLRHVTMRAFASLGRQRALTLRLRGTSVVALPAGLARPLSRVPHFALDLSDNQLVAFGPAVLYPNLTGWNRLATKMLSGGLILSGNPLKCGCSVSWVGAWLRRWIAEVGGGGRAARLAARRSTCLLSTSGEGGGASAVPLIALEADEAECHASALSSRAQRPVYRPLTASLWIVLLHVLS